MSRFSEFIRTANDEEKNEVYKHVMEKVQAEQFKVMNAAATYFSNCAVPGCKAGAAFSTDKGLRCHDHWNA